TTTIWMSLVNWTRTIACCSRSKTGGGYLLNPTFECSKRKLNAYCSDNGHNPILSHTTTCRANLGKNSMPAASILKITSHISQETCTVCDRTVYTPDFTTGIRSGANISPRVRPQGQA